MAMDFAVRRTMLRSITLSARASLRKLDELSKFPSDISPLSYSLNPPSPPFSLSHCTPNFRTFSFLRPGQVPLFSLHNYLHMTRHDFRLLWLGCMQMRARPRMHSPFYQHGTQARTLRLKELIYINHSSDCKLRNDAMASV